MRAIAATQTVLRTISLSHQKEIALNGMSRKKVLPVKLLISILITPAYG